MEKIIYKSMKKVFTEEIKEIEDEINKLFKKYNAKDKKDFLNKANKEDVERLKHLEDQLNRVMECLRRINLKVI
ncbi:hypothetical protein [Methanocaldococcus sp.]